MSEFPKCKHGIGDPNGMTSCLECQLESRDNEIAAMQTKLDLWQKKWELEVEALEKAKAEIELHGDHPYCQIGCAYDEDVPVGGPYLIDIINAALAGKEQTDA